MNDLEKSFAFYLDKNLKKNQNYLRRKYKRGCAKLFHYNPVVHNYAGRKIIGREETNTELNNLALYHMEHLNEDFTEKKFWNSIDCKVDDFENCKHIFGEALENMCGFFPRNDENFLGFVNIMFEVATSLHCKTTKGMVQLHH